MKTCSIENCNNPVWSKGMCKNHTLKKGLSVGNSLQKRTSKQLSKEIDKKIQTHKMFEFFVDLWKKKKHYSEISGEYLGKEPLSVYFHHILPKNKYPEACFDEENIILLTLLEHEQVESDMYRYEEVNKRRNYLLTKYERT